MTTVPSVAGSRLKVAGAAGTRDHIQFPTRLLAVFGGVTPGQLPNTTLPTKALWFCGHTPVQAPNRRFCFSGTTADKLDGPSRRECVWSLVFIWCLVFGV